MTFPLDRITTFDRVQGPQVAVSRFDGAVHVAWMNDTFDDLRYTKSTDLGNAYGAHEVISSGQVLRTSGNGNRNINGNLRAATIPVMRWNNTVGKLAVVWHADAPTTNSYRTVTENGKITASATDPAASLNNFVGDYQDVYVHNYSGTNRAATAFAIAGAFTTYLDIYSSRITY